MHQLVQKMIYSVEWFIQKACLKIHPVWRNTGKAVLTKNRSSQKHLAIVLYSNCWHFIWAIVYTICSLFLSCQPLISIEIVHRCSSNQNRHHEGPLKYKLPLRRCNTLPQETVSTIPKSKWISFIFAQTNSVPFITVDLYESMSNHFILLNA